MAGAHRFQGGAAGRVAERSRKRKRERERKWKREQQRQRLRVGKLFSPRFRASSRRLAARALFPARVFDSRHADSREEERMASGCHRAGDRARQERKWWRFRRRGLCRCRLCPQLFFVFFLPFLSSPSTPEGLRLRMRPGPRGRALGREGRVPRRPEAQGAALEAAPAGGAGDAGRQGRGAVFDFDCFLFRFRLFFDRGKLPFMPRLRHRGEVQAGGCDRAPEASCSKPGEQVDAGRNGGVLGGRRGLFF